MNKRGLLITAGLALALVAWLLSGHLAQPPEPPPEPPRPARVDFAVQARLSEARPITRSITLQGETEPNRRVTLRSEMAGPVAQVLAERGATLQAEEPVVRLSAAEREGRLRQAQARVAERETTYEATRELVERNLQSPIDERQAFAALQEAQAELDAAREAMRQLVVRAPFSGVLNSRPVELGDYVSPGGEIGVLVDNQPLVIRVNLPQHEIARVDPASAVRVRVLGTPPVEGRIRFIAAAADRQTRTFPIEIEIDNADGRLRAGVSASAEIELETLPAHFVSPALLSLDAEGVLGVKTVDDESRVPFHPVELVRSEPRGAWVAGLPERARVITVGQGFVEPGQTVGVRAAEDGVYERVEGRR